MWRFIETKKSTKIESKAKPKKRWNQEKILGKLSNLNKMRKGRKMSKHFIDRLQKWHFVRNFKIGERHRIKLHNPYVPFRFEISKYIAIRSRSSLWRNCAVFPLFHIWFLYAEIFWPRSISVYKYVLSKQLAVIVYACKYM